MECHLYVPRHRSLCDGYNGWTKSPPLITSFTEHYFVPSYKQDIKAFLGGPLCGGRSRDSICMQTCIFPFHTSPPPSGVTMSQLLVTLCSFFLPDWDWDGVSMATAVIVFKKYQTKREREGQKPSWSLMKMKTEPLFTLKLITWAQHRRVSTSDQDGEPSNWDRHTSCVVVNKKKKKEHFCLKPRETPLMWTKPF